MKLLAGTGHRPLKLGGYILPNPTYIKVCQEVEKAILEIKPDKIITGMALGFDQWLANIALKLNIPFIAAIPFLGQEGKWPNKSQQLYKKMLEKAAEIVIVSEGGYAASKLQIRNEWMVDRCDVLVAVFDGTSGGTANCVAYAKEKGKEIVFIKP